MATLKTPVPLVCSIDPSKLEKIQMKGTHDPTNTKEQLFAIAPGNLEVLLAGIMEFKKEAATSRLYFSPAEHYRNFPRFPLGIFLQVLGRALQRAKATRKPILPWLAWTPS